MFKDKVTKIIFLEKPYSGIDRVEIKDDEDYRTSLICTVCNKDFKGWRMLKKCGRCVIPDFPLTIKHITHIAASYVKPGLNITTIYALPAPFRHHNVMHGYFAIHKKVLINETQGFLDNDDNFLNRKQALIVARAANQILANIPLHSDDLYSENIW